MNESQQEEFRAYLNTVDISELLRLQYEIKRSKEPEKHQIILTEFSNRLSERTRINRDAVAHWIIKLQGSEIVLKGYAYPVKVVGAKINSRGNAAMITIEGETRVHYLEYKGEE